MTQRAFRIGGRTGRVYLVSQMLCVVHPRKLWAHSPAHTFWSVLKNVEASTEPSPGHQEIPPTPPAAVIWRIQGFVVSSCWVLRERDLAALQQKSWTLNSAGRETTPTLLTLSLSLLQLPDFWYRDTGVRVILGGILEQQFLKVASTLHFLLYSFSFIQNRFFPHTIYHE